MQYTQQTSVPIVLFAYNRPDKTYATLEALKNNYLAASSPLFLFSDGPKESRDCQAVQDTREVLRNVSGFRSVEMIESNVNLGLANSVISGVSRVLNRFTSVIVLEDDLLTTKNFLDFMNQALSFYESNHAVFSVGGYALPIDVSVPGDFYSAHRPTSWGWGTWRSRWNNIDWQLEEAETYLADRSNRRSFQRGGDDLFRMLRAQQRGRSDSWAIRFAFNQHRQGAVTIIPTISKVLNIGFDSAATHTVDGADRFFTEVDGGQQRVFTFDKNVSVKTQVEKCYKDFFSLKTRASNKLRILARRLMRKTGLRS